GGEPDDGDDGGDGPNDPEDDPSDSDSDQEDASENPSGPPNQLASALHQLSKAIGKEKQPKARSLAKPNKPDTFDGKDPTKLNSFILQCKINFRDNSAAFPTDSDKVNFTLSFLRGTALQWYEPSILDDLYEPWMDDWSLFVSGLRTNFGIIDPVGDAEEELDQLRMKENHHILRYNVDFNRLAAYVPWGNAALCHRYYKGLPDRIKDLLSQQPKIRDLHKLKEVTQTIDARYWERNRKQTRSEKGSASTDRSTDTAKKSKNTNNSGNKNNNSGPSRPTNDQQPCKNFSSSTPKASTPPFKKPDLSSKLGKDGKLTAEERKCRLDNKLCMFCGGA